VLPYNHPPSPPEEIEEDKEESVPQFNAPPYPESLDTLTSTPQKRLNF